LLRSFGIPEAEKATRVALPATPVSFFVHGPEDAPAVFNASAQKGIRFHFPIQATTPEYRDRFWKLFAEYAETWRTGVDDNGWPKDNVESPRPIHWWNVHESLDGFPQEHGYSETAVGVLIVN